MRRLISLLMAICLVVVPVAAMAASDVIVYEWSSDVQFDMYELGFSIVMPDGWTRADDETLNAMNDAVLEEGNAALAEATVDPETGDSASATALYPYVIAMIANADESVKLVITCENLEPGMMVDTADKYLELFANDIVASGAAEGITYTYDMESVSDATLTTQTFREMALVGSDGSLVDLLVCFGGMNSFYAIAINGTQESITEFAPEFVSAIVEMDAVG